MLAAVWGFATEPERDGELGAAPEAGQERGWGDALVYLVAPAERREVQGPAALASPSWRYQCNVACQMQAEDDDEEDKRKEVVGSHGQVRLTGDVVQCLTRGWVEGNIYVVTSPARITLDQCIPVAA